MPGSQDNDAIAKITLLGKLKLQQPYQCMWDGRGLVHCSSLYGGEMIEMIVRYEVDNNLI